MRGKNLSRAKEIFYALKMDMFKEEMTQRIKKIKKREKIRDKRKGYL